MLRWSMSFFSFIFFVLAVALGMVALVFYIKRHQSRNSTPAESRNKNELYVLNFFDNHDLWHFFSSTALFLSFILLLTIEADDLLASCNTHISSKTSCYGRHLSPTDPNDSVPDTPTSPGDVHLATRLTQHMLSKQRTWFCPFCSGQPYHHQHLQDHLLQNHSEELSQVKNETYSKFKPEKCPCCQAEFLKVSIIQF